MRLIEAEAQRKKLDYCRLCNESCTEESHTKKVTQVIAKSKDQLKDELINMRMRQKKITDDFTANIMSQHEKFIIEKEKELDLKI